MNAIKTSPIKTQHINAICKALLDARREFRQAPSLANAVQIEQSYLSSLLSAQSNASGGKTQATPELRQMIESQMLREQATYDKYQEAKHKVFCMGKCLKVALDLQRTLCTIERPHRCRFLETESKGTQSNLNHSFWKCQNPSPAKNIGLYGVSISVMAFAVSKRRRAPSWVMGYLDSAPRPMLMASSRSTVWS